MLHHIFYFITPTFNIISYVTGSAYVCPLLQLLVAKKLSVLTMLHRSGERRQEKTGGVWQLSEKMRLPGTCCTVCPSNVMKYDMKSWFATMWNVLEKEGLLKQTSPVAHYSPQISNLMKQDFVCGQQRSRSWPDMVHTMCMKLAVHLTTNSSPSVHEAMQLVPPPLHPLDRQASVYHMDTGGPAAA